MNPSRYSMLIIAIIVQVLILSSEYLNSVYPLWIGEKITLAVRPVDPRSMFRGNYARLNYDIERLDRRLFKDDAFQQARRGSVVYVSLEKQENVWIPKSVQLEKPTNDLFIRGRVKNNRPSNQTTVQYGIEAYFAPPEKARAIERDMRQVQRRQDTNDPMAAAEVMVAPNGKAALVGVKIDKAKVLH